MSKFFILSSLVLVGIFSCWPAHANDRESHFTYFHIGGFSNINHHGGEVGLGIPGRLYFGAGFLYQNQDWFSSWGPEYETRYGNTSSSWNMTKKSPAVSLTAGYDFLKYKGMCKNKDKPGEDPSRCIGAIRLFAGVIRNLEGIEFMPDRDADWPDQVLYYNYTAARFGVGVMLTLTYIYIGINVGVLYAPDSIHADGGMAFTPAIEFSGGLLF